MKTVGVARRPSVDRKTEIADAAMRIIAMEGARKFTAQSLADEVGITSGAIFRHFDSMEAIVDGILDYMEKELFAEFPPSGNDPIERLGCFFRQRVNVMLRNPMMSRLLLSDYLSQVAGAKGNKRIRKFKSKSRNFIRVQFQEAEDAGLLNRRVGVEEAELLYLGGIFGLAHVDSRNRSRAKVETLADGVWGVIKLTLVGNAKNE